MLTGSFDILSHNFKASPTAYRGEIIKVFAHRHHHFAFGYLQINRLIQAFSAMLIQYVFAGYAQIGRPVLHVSRHIGSPHNNQAYVIAISRQY